MKKLLILALAGVLFLTGCGSIKKLFGEMRLRDQVQQHPAQIPQIN
ncbi:putative lipoprotein [Streptococcus constellatus subsp. pharyngis SK1060 = CCUG 46377]|uniref:Putative lipoprotein n=1 Tax=Streptococcus constellatus subsp. pharyngis SK1060 = CCUG 46377 TaxID=1035184 RepID=F9P4X3_STRCV|nr:putative lipoprotein [Streptococcus constellatus subsp. pharyngis SK1060 = CCUG 46377]